MADDIKFMRRALMLAKKGWGRTSPNPMVGAVIVKDNTIIGEGWHKKAGEAHAEINAINDADQVVSGSTLYVTLEPCSSHGKTLPCTDAIINAKIKRVVIATLDPNPKHQGKAINLLAGKGIKVTVDVEKEKGQELNEAFFCWIQYKRPYVLLKMAMTLDGKIATKNGISQWISCQTSRSKVQRIRQWADAIMVGAETIRVDNPQLKVRRPKNWQNQPKRIVVSKSQNFGSSTYVIDDKNNSAEIVSFNTVDEWHKYFKQLGKENITSLLVEGGGELAGQLVHYNLIDKIAIFIAPKLLGGKDSRTVIGGFNPESLIGAKTINDMKFTRSGSDFLITGYLNHVYRMH